LNNVEQLQLSVHVGNKIEESGAEALLHALKDQTTLSHSTAVIKVPNSGLMRLCIQVFQLVFSLVFSTQYSLLLSYTVMC